MLFSRHLDLRFQFRNNDEQIATFFATQSYWSPCRGRRIFELQPRLLSMLISGMFSGLLFQTSTAVAAPAKPFSLAAMQFDAGSLHPA